MKKSKKTQIDNDNQFAYYCVMTIIAVSIATLLYIGLSSTHVPEPKYYQQVVILDPFYRDNCNGVRVVSSNEDNTYTVEMLCYVDGEEHNLIRDINKDNIKTN